MPAFRRLARPAPAKWPPAVWRTPRDSAEDCRYDKGLLRQRTYDERSLCISHHEEVARPASRPAPALFPADPQWRQGLDHAGRDRPALRAASRELRYQRSDDP